MASDTPEKVLELGPGAGSYALLRLLGRGSQAEVWLARRHGPAGYQREVALKRVRPELLAGEDADESRRMFEEEARTLAGLHDPHGVIAQVYDLHALTEPGASAATYFLAMEYVAGRTLASVIQAARKQTPSRAFSRGFALYVGAQLADALAYAGRRGVVHRDVKPGNIMIATEGAVKLLDFGIAYSRLDTARERTQTGFVKGTFAFMSPEQAEGRRDLTPKSDVFALGVVLCALLTGRRPFVGQSGDGTETRDKVRAASKEDVALALEGVPVSIQAIVQRALARAPEDRYEGGELAAALRGLLLDERLLFGPSEVAREVQELVAAYVAPTITAPPRAAPSPVPATPAQPTARVEPHQVALATEREAKRPARWPLVVGLGGALAAAAAAAIVVSRSMPAAGAPVVESRPAAAPGEAPKASPSARPAPPPPTARRELPPPPPRAPSPKKRPAPAGEEPAGSGGFDLDGSSRTTFKD
jgi:serine/threonine-protein kinase